MRLGFDLESGKRHFETLTTHQERSVMRFKSRLRRLLAVFNAGAKFTF